MCWMVNAVLGARGSVNDAVHAKSGAGGDLAAAEALNCQLVLSLIRQSLVCSPPIVLRKPPTPNISSAFNQEDDEYILHHAELHFSAAPGAFNISRVVLSNQGDRTGAVACWSASFASKRSVSTTV